MKYDIVKHKKFCKLNAPKFYDDLVLLLSGLMLCLSNDLDLMTFGVLNGVIFLYEFLCILTWFISSLVLLIVAKSKHIDLKSINIEDNKDEKNSR